LLADDQFIKAVGAILGHASIELTLEIYAHVLPAQQERLVTSMTGILAPLDQAKQTAVA
jgi:site-specific recombinase XerD